VALQSSVGQGFRDAVAQSQSVFRIAMQAMACPGHFFDVTPDLNPPAPLNSTSAALLLTLCDFETTVWFDASLAAAPGVAEFVRFYTGSRLIEAPGDAAYAVVSEPQHMLPLACFAQGTAEYPDRSATLILQVAALKTAGWKLEGPGIHAHRFFSASPLPADFVQQARTNRGLFPRGVDMFFTTDGALAALPRSTRLTETV
jgi:alpha-D-ribose 1-methylphosphonate 5-triphosphate synthase subunit PhnH